MPIRGHSNVQGIGSVGVTPKLKQQLFDSLASKFGVKLPTSEGRDTLECMESAARYETKVGFCLGGNLYGSNPDAKFAAEALSRLEMNVMLNTTMNTGHAHGLAEDTIVLPVLARDEEPQAYDPRVDVQLCATFRWWPTAFAWSTWRSRNHRSDRRATGTRCCGRRLGSDETNVNDSGHWIGAVVPGYEKITEIDRTKEEFQIEGRTYHTPKFGTEDGLGVMHIHTLPELKGA